MKENIKTEIASSIRVKEMIADTQIANIEAAAKAIIASLKRGGKVLVFGNGGSAADSQHFVAELVGRFKKEREAFGAIALSVNTSTLTAIANDYGYEATFARQVEALGKIGDIAFGISTSGNSRNVIVAIKKARELGLITIGLLGCNGGNIKKECDISIIAESNDTPHVQESHIMIIHIICGLIDEI
ncbi:MAG: D-sedoheptulose 7-phosphate isomerase [Candidatus Omnitrophica bacterium]|nr:D-sedoheptulose 7-phosphate isomerase [Candidatus Omnitrophota bacterium]